MQETNSDIGTYSLYLGKAGFYIKNSFSSEKFFTLVRKSCLFNVHGTCSWMVWLGLDRYTVVLMPNTILFKSVGWCTKKNDLIFFRQFKRTDLACFIFLTQCTWYTTRKKGNRKTSYIIVVDDLIFFGEVFFPHFD